MEFTVTRLFVFQDAFGLICGVLINRHAFPDDDDDDDDDVNDTYELLMNDADGVACELFDID